MAKEFSVTPYEVSGEVNYDKLIEQFGTQKIPESIKTKLKKAHPLLRRGTYFSHRDFDLWLADAEKGKTISIVSGRGPSEKMHLGHLVPFLAVQSLQSIFNCEVYIPISEDEKFYVKPSLSFDQAQQFADDNILDILALGFKKEKTHLCKDFSYAPLYGMAAKVAKLISYSTAKAAFGLQPENNIGWSFYPAVQAVHILLPQFLHGSQRTIVPVGIDQDPFIRLTRDIAEHSSLNFTKPGALHAKFIPGLKGSAKMSSSDAENDVIYLTDSPETVKKKINKYAFSGGKDTLEEHKKHGGNPDIDISFQYLKLLFEDDDKKLNQIEKDYRSGLLLSGELKALLIRKINEFLKNHQTNREKVKKDVEKYLLH
ncbi:MAG TPA: tryptophan--tRNA ligase [Candidatus Nanoarchaeia archaeon]|nr:tryptophan--tRNA ligase [Candidatus Nanoarchaeia archaeon]